MPHHERAERVGHRHHLDDRHAARVAGVRALAAALRVPQRDRSAAGEAPDAGLLDHLWKRLVRLLAMRAQRSHQALRLDADDGRREQVILDAHVEQAVDRPRRVVRVHGREHEVAGERGLHGDLRGLEVADLADHDHVRVLAHDRAQRVREREVDLRLHLDLVDPGHLVLDRILDREDLHVRLVELVERRVERRRLARAGRPRDEEDAVGLLQRLEEAPERVVEEAQLGEVERHAALVEDPHHDALAVHRRHRRHAQVDLLALHAQPDAPVLRQPPLGDVEVREDLDARDHGGREPARRRLDLVQHAVDPVAHDQPVLERLDVDVGRARSERVGDQQRHEADHRRLRREVLQLLHVGVERDLVAAHLDVVADDLAHRALAAPVEPLERRVELPGHRDHRAHAPPGHHRESVDRVPVGRVRHREHELVGVLAHRERVGVAQEPRRHALLEDRQLRIPSAVEHRQPELRGERLGDVARRDEPERHQQGAEALAGVLLQSQGAIEGTRVELAALDQELAQPHYRCRHRRVGRGEDGSIRTMRSEFIHSSRPGG